MKFNLKYSALMISEALACLTLISCGGSTSIESVAGAAPAQSRSNDSSVPTVTITKESTVETAGTTVLEGRASDNKAVVSVTWKNDRGGSGASRVDRNSTEATWSTTTIPLQAGNNTITVTAVDANGNRADATTVINAAQAAAAPSSGMGPNIAANRIPKGSSGVSAEQVKATAELPPAADIGAFRTSCAFSHMGFDDPIVYPGQPGRSHLHAFFGNTGTNANSTASSIATTGNSTCRGGTVNRSAYWVPAIIDTKDGTPVQPESAQIYYKTGYAGIAPSTVQPFPEGLRMIAGDPKNSAPGGPFVFKCVAATGDTLSGQSIPNCPAGTWLWAGVWFPQCWDGVNLDSPDHRSHMAYPNNGACPKTHPVPVPEVSFNIIYSVTEAGAPLRWRFSSDSYDPSLPAGYSSHGDWFNGWKPEVMKAFVKNCDQASVDCHSHLLGDGREIF